MRLWISRNSEVPLREQLVTQVVLGIVSNDLKPGQRLPSTRELARRFKIHSNTVSAAYRELAERGWLEFRKGSGVYVRALAQPEEISRGSPLALDSLIATFLHHARDGGFSLGEIQTRIKHWLELQPPDHFLVLEPDAELRRILVAEIREATGFPTRSATIAEYVTRDIETGAAVVALYSKAEAVAATLPAVTNCLLLHSRSVPESLKGKEPPPPDALVAVVSQWPEFLHWARVVLVAAGLDPNALDFRDARERGWQRGLSASSFVITDACTATQLPADCDTRVFRMISDESLAMLEQFVGQFLTDVADSPATDSKTKQRRRS